MRLSLTLLSSLALVSGTAAQVTFRAGGPTPDCSITASQDTICLGEGVSLTATTNMIGIPSSGSLPFVLGGGVTDIEGNSYTSALIGTQEWTTQNLRTTAYANGEPIPYFPVDLTGLVTWGPCEYNGEFYEDGCWTASDTSEWAMLESGTYCYMNNDPSTEQGSGKMYNGFTFTDPRGLCPQGWHVPSLAEFGQLLIHVYGAEFLPDGIGIWIQDMDPLILSGSNTSGFGAVLTGGIIFNGMPAGPEGFEENTAHFGGSDFLSILPPAPYHVYPNNFNGQLVLTPHTPSSGWESMAEIHPTWQVESCRCIKDQDGSGELQYQWSTGDTTAAIPASPVQTTTYTVNITNGTESCTESRTIVVAPLPEPTIVLDGGMLSTQPSGSSYQWYMDGLAIPNANSAELEIQGNGNYTVVVTDVNGCEGTSDPYLYLSTGLAEIAADAIRIQPNPSNGAFLLKHSLAGKVELRVFDVTGRQVHATVFQALGGSTVHALDLTRLGKGTYSMQVQNQGGSVVQSVVIE